MNEAQNSISCCNSNKNNNSIIYRLFAKVQNYLRKPKLNIREKEHRQSCCKL